MNPKISRRLFLGGAASFGAFSGCRFVSVPNGSFAYGKPNLKFGVVSDIHIHRIGAGEKREDWQNNLTFKHTLEWFRDQGADAVMVAGDMADYGMVDQLQAVAEAWYAVFPNDRAPDGRKVEKLFVHGNHDYHGYLYGDFAAKLYPDEIERRKHVLRADMGGWWKKIFHEDYSRFYVKDIKGYRFLGAHWDDGTGMEAKYGKNTYGVELAAYLDAKGRTLDPAHPFFYFQHPHPRDTCYGPWAWGHDSGLVTKTLSAYSNAVAFSGHSHYSLTDERSLWQGAFTSVGTSSLRYTGMPYNARHPVGYENTTTEAKGREAIDALKATPRFSPGDCRQGMMWNVYDDCIVVQRREFLSDSFLGPDWVMPLPAAEPKPFDFASRAKMVKAPQFAKDAKLVVEKVTAKTRATAGHPAVQKEAYRITIPAALAAPGARPHEYEVAAEGKSGKAATFYVMAEGFNHALTHPRATAPTTCTLTTDRLPENVACFKVRPLDCWWNKGAALVEAAASCK